MPTPKLTDAACQEAIDALRDHDTVVAAAQSLGLHLNTFKSRLRVARMRGFHLSEGARQAMDNAGLSGVEAKGGWIHNYDKDGKKIGTTRWSAEEPELAPEEIMDRIADRMNRIMAAPVVRKSLTTRDDLLNFVPIFDVHMGMRVGSYGTADAVDRLKDGARDVIDRAPSASTIILLTGGDYTEANDNSALTPAHHHPLATDMDFDDLADVAVDAKIDMIEYALTKAERVIYQPLKANHDPAMAVVLRAAMRQRYRDNPRVEIKDGLEFFSHYWEGNLITGIHGHQKNTKPEMLALAIAAKCAADWGKAKHRELWRGHNHKELTVSVPGMMTFQVNPICPPGRYANENLFVGQSDIQCVTYGKGGGRKATTVHIY